MGLRGDPAGDPDPAGSDPAGGILVVSDRRGADRCRSLAPALLLILSHRGKGLDEDPDFAFAALCRPTDQPHKQDRSRHIKTGSTHMLYKAYSKER